MRCHYLTVAAATACIAASGETGAEDFLERERPPVVVEMFLSQACENCPAAADILAELAEREGVVALSWHVDYWDDAVSARGGRWRDPFAAPEFSERQRRYNQQLRGRRRVFTPQAVIQGAHSVVGSKREKIDRMLDAPRSPTPAFARALAPRIRIAAAREKELSIAIDYLPTDHEVLLVRFYEKTATPIRGGANIGTTFIDAHIVEAVGAIDRRAITMGPVRIAAPLPRMGCAVLVQSQTNHAIANAAYCPETE